MGPLAAVLVLGVLAGCAAPRSSEGERKALRLADHFADAKVEGSPGDAGQPPRTEWIFDDSGGGGAKGWQALAGVGGLAAGDGALRGRSEAPVPVIGIDWSPTPEQSDDQIHSIEVRLRASAGGRIGAALSKEEQVFLPPLLAPDNPFGFIFTSPIVPGDDSKLYTLRPIQPQRAAGIRHLLLKPIDVPGGEFAIESVRVVFEREHLRSIPAGLSWQGLGGTYRETLVARSPETLRFDVTLPADPYLELAAGTLAPGAVGFEIEIGGSGDSGSGRRVRRTVTTPNRWEEIEIDLAELGGESTQLALRVEAPDAGTIGLWGSPVIRSRVDAGARVAAPQGIVVVLIDTLRRDHLAVWGYDRDTAPHLSRLAEEGVVADDAISQAAWTKVSVPSILTSLYPTTNQVADFPDLLSASAETMAEVFRGAGYATFGFSAIPFTGKMTNLHQGYERFRETTLDLAIGGTVVEKQAQRYVDDLLPWLERHRDVPFFVFLHVEDPHSPYVAPRPFAGTWAEAGDAERLAAMIDQVRPKIDNPLMQMFGMPERSDLDEAGVDATQFVAYERDAYDALIRATDAEIARVVERLEELGLRDRVLVAFISDHGTEFLDHGKHFHGHTVYGELNRVPMFFWGPAFVPAGVHIPATVQSLDFMPTVLELAGLPVPEAAQGQSLRPWFQAGGGEAEAAANGWRRAPAITEKPFVAAREPGGYASFSIVTEGWKLIQNVAPPSGVAEYELYDHVKDPLNLTDLAAEHPEKVKELGEQLVRWREKAVAAQLPSDAEMASQASPEELERLRALGYL